MAGEFQVDGVIPRKREAPSVGDEVSASASLSAVLSDLVALEPEAGQAQSTAEAVDRSKAVAALHREVAASISPQVTSAEAEPASKAPVRQTPRLDRIPTLAIRPAPTIVRRFLETFWANPSANRCVGGSKS